MPLNRHYRHIVLSPHLDDAPLSCGGAIHRWAAAGEPVLIITLMTGDPPAGPLSPFADYQHAAWEVPAAEAFATRRAEEAAALQELGADWDHLGFLDCIYRGNETSFFYTSDEAIFGSIHPADASLVDDLSEQLAALELLAPGAAVYAPLAIGNHIDHQLVRQAAGRWRGRNLLYYEDYPYAGRVGAQTDAPQIPSLRIPLAKADMEAKIRAIGRYRSQINMLFGSNAQMETDVWAFGRRTADRDGWAERFWHPSQQTR
jgi:LmbE family N-acetylglucosaminyl deacetylase